MSYEQKLKDEWRGWNAQTLSQNKEHMDYFNLLYLKNFGSPGLAEAISSVIGQLENESEVLYEELSKESDSLRETVCWHMG